MEVSSHALVMGRVDGVVFDVGGVHQPRAATTSTSTRDMEDYFAAKADLFTRRRARRALVNVDDPYGRRLLERAEIPDSAPSPSEGADSDWAASGHEALGGVPAST